jgi:hypothetical protein
VKQRDGSSMAGMQQQYGSNTAAGTETTAAAAKAFAASR